MAKVYILTHTKRPNDCHVGYTFVVGAYQNKKDAIEAMNEEFFQINLHSKKEYKSWKLTTKSYIKNEDGVYFFDIVETELK